MFANDTKGRLHQRHLTLSSRHKKCSNCANFQTPAQNSPVQSYEPSVLNNDPTSHLATARASDSVIYSDTERVIRIIIIIIIIIIIRD